MLGEPRLNIYILGSDLTAQQRQRVQAQVQTALRAIPGWAFQLLAGRMAELGVRNLPLMIEPRPARAPGSQALSLGRIESRPAVRLTPRLAGAEVEWGQDARYLVAKAIAYLAAPESTDTDFWSRWVEALEADRLREKALAVGAHWQDVTTLGLLIEMFAAYALEPQHRRWAGLPRVRAFLDDWR
ncbi:MAG: hypothetical protein Q7T33_11140 [Dehalococcoidia bacterium]|nr:hypothetical protein [Dehalococcoidia bacterium]